MTPASSETPLITEITPETKHYAFSRGYRAGLHKKRLTDMPSSIRLSQKLREEYAAGWQEAQDEMQAGSVFASKDNKIQRFIWFGATIAAGLLIAYFSIQKAEQATPTQQEIQPANQLGETPSYDFNQPASLSLLTPEERSALTQATENLEPLAPLPLEQDFNLVSKLLDQEQQELPTYFYFPTRNISFQLQTKSAEKSQLKIRWLWQRNLIQEEQIILTPTTPTYSQQTMTKARQGKWEIEILDLTDKLLYLYTFYFEPQNETTKH